jgi:hypothetical protein
LTSGSGSNPVNDSNHWHGSVDDFKLKNIIQISKLKSLTGFYPIQPDFNAKINCNN